MAEFGCCHRNEPHGALHGILRVRQFTQDDAHIFCREDQLVEEVRLFCDLLDSVYKDLGFAEYAIKLALRPEKRFGSRRDVGLVGAVAARRGDRDGAGDGGIWLGGTAGRGRLLCAQARIPPDRRDRPHLAGRHDADRHGAARAARRLLCRRGRRAASPDHAPPRHPRHVRALHRHTDRASCRPLPALAGAGAGGGGDDRLRGRRSCPRGRGGACAPPAFASRPTFATRRSTTRCASTASPTSPISSSSASARRRRGRWRCARSARTRGRKCSALDDALVERLEPRSAAARSGGAMITPPRARRDRLARHRHAERLCRGRAARAPIVEAGDGGRVRGAVPER